MREEDPSNLFLFFFLPVSSFWSFSSSRFPLKTGVVKKRRNGGGRKRKRRTPECRQNASGKKAAEYGSRQTLTRTGGGGKATKQ